MAETRKAESEWRGTGDCAVTVKHNGADEVLVRHSLQPATVLRLTTAEWSAFRDRVTGGEFD